MQKVSVIVPIYNSEKYISKCIDSVLNQSYKNIEILLINDGSKDNSINILREYEKKDKRVVVIDKENEGVSKTRNLGIKKASGDYIMFVDNDDFLEKDCIKHFIENIGNNDLIIGGYRRVSDKKTLFEYRLKDTEWSKYIIMAPWSKLYKKSFLLDNNIEFPSLKIGEDVGFNFHLYTKTNKIKITNYQDYNWYYNSGSVSNTSQKGLNKELSFQSILNYIVSLDGFYSNEYNLYYIKRYIVWYLLFSGRYSSKEKFINEYKDLVEWKKKNNIISKLRPFSRKLKGESFKNRISVFVFNLTEKLHLIKLFASIYCKGE